jgi:hypothetical protein
MALIKNNAKVAAQIAVELAKIQKNDGDDKTIFTSFPASQSNSSLSPATPLVIGGSILDIHYHVEENGLEVSKPFFSHKIILIDMCGMKMPKVYSHERAAWKTKKFN